MRAGITAERYVSVVVDHPVFPKSDEDREKIQSALLDNFFFQKLATEQMDTLTDAMSTQRFAKGTQIIKEGSDGKKLYILISGMALYLLQNLSHTKGFVIYEDSRIFHP